MDKSRTCAISRGWSSRARLHGQQRLGGKPATAIAIYQLPGSNALATSDRAVRKKMVSLNSVFPSGTGLHNVYDPTVSVRESIHEVQKTLFEAIALVVLSS